MQSGDVVLLTDMPDKSSGVSAPRLKPAVYIKTLSPWPFEMQKDEEGARTIHGGGEYDASGITIKGWNVPEASGGKYFKTIYRLGWDDITIGLLGHISAEIPPQLLEPLEEIDVLIGPAGGAPFLEEEKMVRLIKQLNPKIFIPSFVASNDLKRKAGNGKQVTDPFDAFSDEARDAEKFTFKKKDIQEIKKTRIVTLRA